MWALYARSVAPSNTHCCLKHTLLTVRCRVSVVCSKHRHIDHALLFGARSFGVCACNIVSPHSLGTFDVAVPCFWCLGCGHALQFIVHGCRAHTNIDFRNATMYVAQFWFASALRGAMFAGTTASSACARTMLCNVARGCLRNLVLIPRFALQWVIGFAGCVAPSLWFTTAIRSA